MPLRDHFHAPLEDEVGFSSIHSIWASTIVRHLNERILPGRYRAQPEVHLGQVIVDIATLELQEEAISSSGNGVATAVWAPPTATRSTAVAFTAQDIFEVRVTEGPRRLVAAIELISPGNKDRPDARRDFAVKCASYLQQQVSVVIVDIVTERQFDLYGELMTLLDIPRETGWPGDPPLYAVAMRTAKPGGHWQFDAWEEALSVGAALPTLPLWLASDLAVPVDLEASYEETCRVLRIP